MEPKDDQLNRPADVQIKADLKEMRRRIAAFQARKRAEVDELNLQEFCSRRSDIDNSSNAAETLKGSTCCRVDAVVVRRTDSKGHIKVSRVENQWGPQMMQLASRRVRHLDNPTVTDVVPKDVIHQLPEGIEERIGNMETHLSLKTGKPVPKDIYARLKSLEDRILFLESISPDYFTDQQPSRKALKTDGSRRLQNVSTDRRRGLAVRSSQLSLDDIEARIRTLRGSLLHLRPADS